tara:strand:+ start:359 stop:784 length:426 start_codon:yes stop_codon:yes gene_type:complete
MSWGTCYNGSNNIHFNFPSLMDDGRNFTNYQATPALDSMLKTSSNIKSNNEYRHFLQTNADSIIKNNQLDACNQCGSCVYNKPINNTTLNGQPYIFNSSLSNDQPYGYESSDLKNIYLSRKQLDLQKRVLKYKINLEENNI